MKNIESNFVPYKIALDMKLIGFDEPCLAYWDDDKVFELNSDFLKGSQMDDKWLAAPTFSQIFKFFREKYKLSAIVSQFGYGIENEFGVIVYTITDDENPLCYEESELVCLNRLIEIVKNEVKL